MSRDIRKLPYVSKPNSASCRDEDKPQSRGKALSFLLHVPSSQNIYFFFTLSLVSLTGLICSATFFHKKRMCPDYSTHILVFYSNSSSFINATSCVSCSFVHGNKGGCTVSERESPRKFNARFIMGMYGAPI